MKRIQRPDGSWYGSWGVCFTYAAWFGVAGLAEMGERDGTSDAVTRALAFLYAKQRDDGGWGESYLSSSMKEYHHADESQVVNTAWAMMAILDGTQGVADSEAKARPLLAKAAAFLVRSQEASGDWPQQLISGVFNHNCMITYANYRNIFPIWALGEYRARYLGAGERGRRRWGRRVVGELFVATHPVSSYADGSTQTNDSSSAVTWPSARRSGMRASCTRAARPTTPARAAPRAHERLAARQRRSSGASSADGGSASPAVVGGQLGHRRAPRTGRATAQIRRARSRAEHAHAPALEQRLVPRLPSARRAATASTAARARGSAPPRRARSGCGAPAARSAPSSAAKSATASSAIDDNCARYHRRGAGGRIDLWPPRRDASTSASLRRRGGTCTLAAGGAVAAAEWRRARPRGRGSRARHGAVAQSGAVLPNFRGMFCLRRNYPTRWPRRRRAVPASRRSRRCFPAWSRATWPGGKRCGGLRRTRCVRRRA